MARQQMLEDFVSLIGRAILRERRRAGKSQEDLAYEAQMSVRHLRELEQGRANPTVETLCRLAETLGVPVNVLFEEKRRAQR
jgi:transcriptional regulator with XRE-family HTH domain